MRIIPAIDIIDGKCVRLTKGDYATKKVYNESPVEVAKEFEAHGIRYLHLVDLDGAKSHQIVNYRILESIASQTGLQIDFGGGLKSDADLRIAFECGASQITGGSIAVKDKSTFVSWISKHGSEKIILGADALDENIAVAGWQETSQEKLIPFIQRYQKEGIHYVICTDISKDGMLEGPSVPLYKKILAKTKIIKTTIGLSGVEDEEVAGIKLIASGGIAAYNDLNILREIGCDGAIVGKAIYENRISLKQLEQFILLK
jgi:phosphoribosylformimino-5-aminoimidazole carboxamide ribotide isomerase